MVGGKLGISSIRAGCLPQEKVVFVEDLKARGELVAVVGDGVNDAPALAAGDIGIAMGAIGSDVAVQSASIALMNNDLRRIPFLVALSRKTRSLMNQNLAFGLAMILGGLYLSAAGKLSPIVAAILHCVGTLGIVFNSARLVRAGEDLERSDAPADPSLPG
jgi:Cd2+/Zn2+-exporting ATPase